MGNSRKGYGSGSVVVVPSMNKSMVPTGAFVMVNRPVLSVNAVRLVPRILAVTLGRGSLASSSTIPETVVVTGLLASFPDAVKTAGDPVKPANDAVTTLLLIPGCISSTRTAATRPSVSVVLVTETVPSTVPFPLVIWNVTGTPDVGFPKPSTTAATMASGTGWPATPVC